MKSVFGIAHSGLCASTASRRGEPGGGVRGSRSSSGIARDGTGSVSAMRTADTAPDTNVSAATSHIAACQSEHVGRHAGDERADGVAEIAPEAIDTDRGRAPRWRGDVADPARSVG